MAKQTQKLSTDFIRVVHQTSRNQFQKPYSWVRMNQTSSKDKRTARKVSLLSGHCFFLLIDEMSDVW